MTELAVMVGDGSYQADETRFVGRIQTMPYNEETSHYDSSFDYYGAAVREAIRESMWFDHNVAKVTDAALLFTLGRESTYTWSDILREAAPNERSIGDGWTWESGFPHPESARLPNSTKRFAMFAVDTSSMPNEWYFLGEKIGSTGGVALRGLLRRNPQLIETYREATDYILIADWTSRTVVDWDTVGFPADDRGPEHDGEIFYRHLPHRSLDETSKELDVQSATSDDGTPQPLLTVNDTESGERADD